MFSRELFLDTQAAKCLLCHDAGCAKACSHQIRTDKIIRSYRFENEEGARSTLGTQSCEGCVDKPCVSACTRGKLDSPVDIPGIIREIGKIPCTNSSDADLSSSVCGIPCENPFFLSSSVVGSNYEMVAKAFEMGWAGVAFKTVALFVPEEVSPRFAELRKEGLPYVGFKNIEQLSDHTLEENLDYLHRLKTDFPTKIIIASIMGRTEEEWTELARLMEHAGADVIECNFSCPHMSADGLGSDIGTQPELVAAYVKATKMGTSLPVLAKMTPNITNMEIPAAAAMAAGADGIAAINTIKSIMNINLDSFASEPDVKGKSAVGGYSGKAVKPIALRFIHDMAVSSKMDAPEISGMGGIETWRDAAEFIVAGCATVQVTTAVMQYGYRIIEDLTDGMARYLISHGGTSIASLVGRALGNVVPTDTLDRQTICFPKFDREHCVGCGRCFLSCYDGGHQAISFGEDSKPKLLAKNCVGCHLCLTVCPAGAISPGNRVEKSCLQK